MAYTSDPNVIFQMMVKHLYGQQLVAAPQITGSYYAVVYDTWETNPVVSQGNMRVIVPSLDTNFVWDEIPHPGAFPPPPGTPLSVTFSDVDNSLIPGTYFGYTPQRITIQAGAPTNAQGNTGDIWIDPVAKKYYIKNYYPVPSGPGKLAVWTAGASY